MGKKSSAAKEYTGNEAGHNGVEMSRPCSVESLHSSRGSSPRPGPLASFSSRSHTSEESTTNSSSSPRSDSSAASNGSSDSPTEGSTISSPRVEQSASFSSISNTIDHSATSDSPSARYWSSRLFSASPKPHDGIMLLEWMESVIDYCREKHSKITIPEELEKYRYAKACLDSIVNEVRKILKVSDRDVNQNISCPSFKLSYRLKEIYLGHKKIMELIRNGSISFNTLVSDLKKKIESISKNYQHSEQHKFKQQFLTFLINSLDTCLKEADSSNSLKQEVDIKLEELKDEVSKETSELTDIIRYAPQDSAASIALRLPLEPLTGKKVQAMYDHVCLLSDLQNNKELLTPLPKIISELEGELITLNGELIANINAYSCQGEAVTQVKRTFVNKLLEHMRDCDLMDTAQVESCEKQLIQLKKTARPAKVSFGPYASALHAKETDPFYTEFRSISRVEKFYNRSCDLVKCAQAVSSLSNPSVDGQTNGPPMMVA